MARPTDSEIKAREEFLNTIKICAETPSEFSRIFLDHELYDYNKEYVDSKERFILYRSGRQAGKTMSTAVKAVHYAFFAPIMKDTIKDECIILIAAPTQNQSAIMFGRIRKLVESSDILSQYILKSTQTEITIKWMNGRGSTRIITRATGEQGITLRGYSPHVIIADECSFIKRSIMVAFLPSGMATQADIWLTSTPYGKNTYFYECHLNSRPLNKDGLWKEFHVSSLQNPTVKNDPLFHQQIKELAQEEYIQEVEGEFLDIGDALFPREMLLEAISDRKPYGRVRWYLGIDVARSGKDETVYTTLAVDDDNTIYVIDQEAEGQSNMMDVASRIQHLMQIRPYESIFIDETGLGGGLIDICRSYNLPVRGVIFTMTEKVEMYTNLRVFFENHKIKIPTIGKLINQLQYMRREYTEEQGRLKIVSDTKDDYADSLAVACCAMSRGDTWHVINIGKDLKRSLFG